MDFTLIKAKGDIIVSCKVAETFINSRCSEKGRRR